MIPSGVGSRRSRREVLLAGADEGREQALWTNRPETRRKSEGSAKKNARRLCQKFQAFFFTTTTTKMSADLAQLEKHLSSRSYVEG